MSSSWSYNYGSDFSAGDAAAFGVGMVAVLGIVLFFALAVGIVIYIFQSLGMYTIAKRRGMNNPWLAWIPIGNLWIMGSISDNYMEVTELKQAKYRYVLLWMSVATTTLSIIASAIYGSMFATVIGAVLENPDNPAVPSNILFSSMSGIIIYLILIPVAITAAVFQYIAMYRVYKSCMPKNAVLFILLSIFVSGSGAIIMFVIRKKDEGMIPAYVNPPYQGGM